MMMIKKSRLSERKPALLFRYSLDIFLETAGNEPDITLLTIVLPETDRSRLPQPFLDVSTSIPIVLGKPFPTSAVYIASVQFKGGYAFARSTSN
jgi:hypothetical protein